MYKDERGGNIITPPPSLSCTLGVFLVSVLQPGVSQLPEHLDGVDEAHVGIVEVVESAQGKGGQGPDQTEEKT